MQSPAPREEQPQAPVHAGDTQLENSFAEKDPGVLVDTKMIISQQCANATKVANISLGCVRRSSTSRLEGGDPFPLISTGGAVPGFWALQHKRDGCARETPEQSHKNHYSAGAPLV